MTWRNLLLYGVVICALAIPVLGAAHAKNFRVLPTFKDTPDGATQWSELRRRDAWGSVYEISK